MLKTFPLDFIRQLLEQTLFEEHEKNVHYFGGPNQINIFSYYEQLENPDEVNRFVECYRDIINQENNVGLIGNGVLTSPENPTITNLYTSLIIPMSFTCSIRTTLGDRDQMIDTLFHLIEVLKGKKFDIAELDTGKLFKVGTIGNHLKNSLTIENGDFINVPTHLSTGIAGIILGLVEDYGFVNNVSAIGSYVYYEKIDANGNHILQTAVLKSIVGIPTWVDTEDDGTYTNILFPPQHKSFEKYKMSISFDSLRVDEPRELNSEKYCEISFGGSSTLVSNGVKLGNDLIKLGFNKIKLVAKTSVNINSSIEYIEPLEQPSSNDLNTQINQLISNKFMTNSHTDGMTPTLQYSFMIDENSPFLTQLFNYARYGTQASSLSQADLTNGITPNILYGIREVWVSWGAYNIKDVKGKIVENIEIENTESDVMSLTVSFQLQGANN